MGCVAMTNLQKSTEIAKLLDFWVDFEDFEDHTRSATGYRGSQGITPFVLPVSLFFLFFEVRHSGKNIHAPQ
jgi:hypothetical protein